MANLESVVKDLVLPNSDIVLGTGLEEEKEEYEGQIVEPFNPEQIKIRTVPILVEHLLQRIQHGELDLNPEFQRKQGIWPPEAQSRLIESLLLRIPIPVFYVAAEVDENWLVVDGVQRISTFNNFARGKFALKGLEYLDSLEGRKHNELPRHMQRRISETQLIVNVIEPGTPSDVMFNVFKRINTGGKTLNGQEIRNAIHAGPVRSFLKELAGCEEFLTATDRSINPKRMDDRECVLRFLAFYIFPHSDYKANKLNKFLSKSMKCINEMSCRDRAEIAADFKKAMNAAYEIFGKKAFRKQSQEATSRFPISRTLFEVWSVQLAKCSPAQIDCLIDQRDGIREKFIELLVTDNEFYMAISYTTGSPMRVHKRFDAIEQLIQGFVKC